MSRARATALETYAKVLPESEFRALVAWSGEFYPFQQDWLFEQARRAIANKSRQIGWSHTTSAVGVLWSAFHGQLTTFISVGDREAKEILEKARLHALILQALGSKMACFGRKDTASEITFAVPGKPNHGRILALPASAGRGFTGNCFLDEYAYQEHAAAVWERAAPVTLLGFKLRVVSTPNGIGNEFANLWMREDDDWARHEIPIETAIAQGFPVDMENCWSLAHGDPRIFAQMFQCSFLDSEFQYIPTDAIDGCTYDYDVAKIHGEQGEYFAGLDIGREADRTVLVIVKRVKKVCYPVHIEVTKRTDWEGLDRMVDLAFEKFRLRRLCIDANGIGSFPAEQIKKRHSERIDVPHRRPRVECLDFTMKDKESLATGLYSSITNHGVNLPADNTLRPDLWPLDKTQGIARRFNEAGTAEALRKELASIRRIITAAGNVKYDAPRTAEGHADRAWALALALHAGSSPNALLEALNAA